MRCQPAVKLLHVLGQLQLLLGHGLHGQHQSVSKLAQQ